MSNTKLSSTPTNQGIVFHIRQIFGDDVKIEIEEKVAQTTLDGKEEVKTYVNKSHMAGQGRSDETPAGKRKGRTAKQHRK